MTKCEALLKRRRNRRLTVFIILLIIITIIVLVRLSNNSAVQDAPVVNVTSEAQIHPPREEPQIEYMVSEVVEASAKLVVPVPADFYVPVEETSTVPEPEPEPEPVEVDWRELAYEDFLEQFCPEHYFTYKDFDYIARKVAAECGGIYAESYEGHVAVAQCIKNRLESDEWPDNIYDVCVTGQFAEKYGGNMELYYNCYDAVWDVFHNDVVAFDEPVIYFLNPKKVPGTSMKWHADLHYIGTIGNHEFFS